MKVKTCPEIKGNKLPLIYYGNKRQQMYVSSLIGSSLKPATQPHPWPSPSKENKLAVNAVGKKNMVNHWYYSWLWHLERLHEDKLTFKYEHKHSDKKKHCKNHVGWKNKQKTDGRFMWIVAQLAENSSLSVRGSFPRSDCPCGRLLSFMVLLSPKTPAAKSSRETPTTTVFHTWDWFSTFNYDLFKRMMWQTEMSQTAICKKKKRSSIEVILVLMSFGILFLCVINLFFLSLTRSNRHTCRLVYHFLAHLSIQQIN